MTLSPGPDHQYRLRERIGAAPFSALHSIAMKGHLIRNILSRNGIGECIHENARRGAISADTSTLQQAIDLWHRETPYSFKITYKKGQ
jgi:hypothetical protein